MTTQQPEALDLANWLDAVGNGGISSTAAAAELRRQHTRIAELEAQLEAIGAGGMSGPLMGCASIAASAGSEPAPTGEPWHGHQFKEVRHGYWQCDCGKAIKEAEPTPIADKDSYPPLPSRYTYDDDGEELFSADQMLAFADATHALRASHGQAPARADMQDAYVGAREDLAIWKRRALEAERDLRAERETASLLAAEINAINGLTHLGEPAPTAQPAPAQVAPQQEAQEPVAWYVTGCGRLLDEDEAKAEARRIGGTARAIPLYTAPQADSVQDLQPVHDAVTIDLLNERVAHLERKLKEADSVLEDAARLEFEMQHGSAIAAARKQGANHD